MKFSWLIVFGMVVTAACSRERAGEEAVSRRADSLLAEMTLEEKIGQMNLVLVGFDVTGPVVSENVEENIRNGLVGGVFNTYTTTAARKLQEMAVKESRLGIPLLFGYDVIHGHRTIFPINLGMAASWDLEAIEESARIAAEEASSEGLNWVFSPMADLARDPRWGRVSEGAGEDAWLGGKIAGAMVRGYQGSDLSAPNTVMACVKHFALYGAAEAGRDYNTVDMSLHRMFQDYLPPYKAALDAGAGSVMTAFNEINGIPATGNAWLLTELLRNRWGFNGLVVTDYTSINEMIPHGFGKNEYEVGRLALEAGVDMDMVGEVFVNQLQKLVEEEDGGIAETRIDSACKRILEAKFRLGLMNDPFRYINPDREAKTQAARQEHRKAARDMARKSMVLLKNEGRVLPLEKTGTIALIGPLADNRRDMIGSWSAAGDWKEAVSLREGMEAAVGDGVQILYAKGANITNDSLLTERLNAHGGELQIDPRPAAALIREALQAARTADVIVAAVGESQGMSGEAASRSEIGLPGRQLDLLKALKETGKPLVIVLMNGRPLALPWEDEHADAILETWFAGSEAGHAIADVLFGDYNPSGKLPMTFPRSVGQVPLYYNHKNTGRPFNGKDPLDKYKSRYLDVSNEPLYPFGYGLSYTRFTYSNLRISKENLQPGDSLQVEVTVRNAGDYDGEETVQLYIRDLVGSVTRPVKELKNFRKIYLKKGESTRVAFHIRPEDLAFYRADMEYAPEPGAFEVYVGGNSAEVKSGSFIFSGTTQ